MSRVPEIANVLLTVVSEPSVPMTSLLASTSLRLALFENSGRCRRPDELTVHGGLANAI